MGAALGIGDEARVRRPLGMAEGRRELREEAVVAGGDDHRPVLRLKPLERHEALGTRALPRGQIAGELVARHVAGEPAECRLEERGIDDDAAAGACALMKRREHAHGCPHAGAEVQHGRAEARRRILVSAVHAEKSREGLHHRLVPRTEPTGAAPSECPQGAEHQPRIELEERVRTQPQLLDDARSEILHEHVRLGQIALEPRDGLRIFQVEDDGALVHIDGVEGGATAESERRAPAARFVTLRPLDLHDIRAHVGQDLAGERTGQSLGDLDDLDAFERQRCSHGEVLVSVPS